MSWIDWTIMSGTILFIVGYGIWKSRGTQDIKGYLLADNDMKWWTIGLSIMATQASAITFLSTPGQAFDDGMRFVQFYFGVPIAMVLISMVAIPIYKRLNVFTAYEYLESRFDLKTRSFAALLFLVSRSLAAGLTIYAPAIILATILGWDTGATCVGIGLVVMLYTVAGGTKAVSQTQQQQMAIILVGMLIAGIVMVFKMPPDVGFMDAMSMAGSMGKLNAITTDFDIKDRYNIWSGLIAGTFLALSYFGTDQSQVQRYLGGKSITESRIGLLFNGLFKVPMQFLILLVGILLFVFYQFQTPPMVFNQEERTKVVQSEAGDQYLQLENRFNQLHEEKAARWNEWLDQGDAPAESRDATLATIKNLDQESQEIRSQAKEIMAAQDENADTNDLDRVFLTFVLNHLPVGLVGLLIAVILSAAMSSTSAELNALASTTVVDVYKRLIKPSASDRHYLNISRSLTMSWGVLAIIFALIAGQFENLIEYVNILGSLFYGTILGIFVTAFFFKRVKGTAVFIAGIIGEITVITCFVLPKIWPEQFAWLDIGFLWFNLIGCVVVVIMASLIQLARKE
ncbi:MAG: sodium:solute symporter [Bacteroidota bacterium]